MSRGFLQQFWGYLIGRPGPEFVAWQLRKPSGKFAGKIGQLGSIAMMRIWNHIA